MAEELNATCAICGQKYHMCSTCSSTKTYKPWRTITDTIGCYKIYMIIYDYRSGKINIEKANEELTNCIIPDTLQTHIKQVIDEILAYKKPMKIKKNNVKKEVHNDDNMYFLSTEVEVNESINEYL